MSHEAQGIAALCILWTLLLAGGCFGFYRLGYAEGHDDGLDEGWHDCVMSQTSINLEWDPSGDEEHPWVVAWDQGELRFSRWTMARRWIENRRQEEADRA